MTRAALLTLTGMLAASPAAWTQSGPGGPWFENLSLAAAAEVEFTSNLAAQAQGNAARVLVPRVAARYADQAPRWSADLSAVGQWFNYDAPEFGDVLLATVDANFSGWLPQGRLRWDLRHKAGPINADPLEPRNPDNLELVASSQAGPRLFLRPGRATRLEAGLHFGDFRVLDLNRDNQRQVADLLLVRTLRPGMEFSAGVEHVESTSNNVDDLDFERSTAHVRLQRVGGRAKLDVGLAYARGEVENGTQSREGGGWLKLSRRFAGSHLINARYVSETADTGSRLVAELSDEGETLPSSLDSLTAVADISTVEDLGLTWLWNPGRLQISLALRERREDFLISPFDRDERSAAIDFAWALTPRQTLVLGGMSGEREFPLAGRLDEYVRGSLSWAMSPRRGWQYRLSAGFSDQVSDNAEFSFETSQIRAWVVFGDPLAAELLR